MIETVELYAEIAASLATADDRREVLERHGLNEETWEAIDDEWQARLSAAVEAFDEDGVPELIDRFHQAFARARERLGEEVLPFEKFIEVTRAVQRSADIPRTLEQHGMTFAVFARANQYWTVKLATDPELAARFSKAIE